MKRVARCMPLVSALRRLEPGRSVSHRALPQPSKSGWSRPRGLPISGGASALLILVVGIKLMVAGCASAGDTENIGTNSSSDSVTSSAGGTSGSPATMSASATGGSSTTGSVIGWPPCGQTQDGEEIKKGVACRDGDTVECRRGCGPESVGAKSETCISGFYAEGDCQFDPSIDHSCYALPEQLHASCPTDAPPQATAMCTVAACTPCNLNGIYLDSGGSMKQGYCVCKEPDSNGEQVWTCATIESWPCPSANGC